MSEAQQIRVLIVDDHELFTEALTATLEQDDRFHVVGAAKTGREAVRLAKTARADVVLMDMSMPVLDGLAATRRLLALDPAPRVIALSGHTDRLSQTAALDSGASVFVSKSEPLDTLTETIVDVCGGRRVQPAGG